MARIDQRLLEAIAGKQQITIRAVYPQISRIVNETFLERDLAALVLATRLKINISKYSNPTQRAAIRGHMTSGGSFPPVGDDARSRPLGTPRKAKTVMPRRAKGNSVFVVHGRDEELRRSMFEFLRALGLNPMEWTTAVSQAKGGNPYIGDILNSAMNKVQAVVVLFSPDELAQLKQQFWGADDKNGDGRLAGQARPNVIFEAGLALGAHPEKTVIVQVGRVRPFSDIAGKYLVRLSRDKGRSDLANRLRGLGCPVVTTGEDWMRVGRFEPAEPKPVGARKKPVRAGKKGRPRTRSVRPIRPAI